MQSNLICIEDGLRTTRDDQAFLASPIDCCLLGRTFVIWCAGHDLVGTIVWGVLSDRDLRDIIRIWGVLHHRPASSSRRGLLDCRQIEHTDVDILQAVATIAPERAPKWSPDTMRQALVVPDGLHGMLLAGALSALIPGAPPLVVRDLEAAFAAVDHPCAPAAHAAASAHTITARELSSLIGRLRSHLRTKLHDASIENVAAALGLSTRSLQRELHTEGTSFSKELRRARVVSAEELLLTGMKIEAIAARVGYGTASRMSAVLRRERGATAGELRARARQRGACAGARRG